MVCSAHSRTLHSNPAIHACRTCSYCSWLTWEGLPPKHRTFHPLCLLWNFIDSWSHCCLQALSSRFWSLGPRTCSDCHLSWCAWFLSIQTLWGTSSCGSYSRRLQYHTSRLDSGKSFSFSRIQLGLHGRLRKKPELCWPHQRFCRTETYHSWYWFRQDDRRSQQHSRLSKSSYGVDFTCFQSS